MTTTDSEAPSQAPPTQARPAGERPPWQSLPWSWYSDPAVEQVEQAQLFARSWQYFSSTEQLQSAGDFVAGEHGKVPVVVVRGHDRTLRGFLNVCRHRGTRVCVGAGNRPTLQCPYHAWTYELDGRLRSAPRSGREPDFDPGGLGLRPVKVDTWGPMVFVNLDRAASPLSDALGTLPDLVATAGVDVSALRVYQRAPYEIAANWKIVLENYLECYHCPVAHPGLSAVIEVGPSRYELAEAGPILSHRTSLRDKRRSEPYELDGAVAGGSYYLVWPSMTVDINPGHPNLAISTVYPDGPLRTYGVTDNYFGQGVEPEWAEAMMAFDRQVGTEDQQLVEAAQIGLANGIIDHGRLLLDSERLLAVFEHRVFDACAPYLG